MSRFTTGMSPAARDACRHQPIRREKPIKKVDGAITIPPSAQKEYIITDSDRNYILSHPEDMRTIYGIMERARPYTSASSDVLEILHDKIDAEVELSGNRPDGHGERVAYNKMLFWVKELRQQTKEHP
jgi:hypothetical protein